MKHLVLLVNLGSPEKLTPRGVYRFLTTFLSDTRVVGLPKLFWRPLLFLLIAPLRIKRLAKQYKKIAINNTSPLIYYSESLATKVAQKFDSDTMVCSAFSYTTPTIGDILSKYNINLLPQDKLTIIPLYPQYSSTTTASVFDRVWDFYKSSKYQPNINCIRDFYHMDEYISMIARKIIHSWSKAPSKLIFSYHSLPKRIIKQGDIYYDQCIKTTGLVVEKINTILSNDCSSHNNLIKTDDYIVSFQSKFGFDSWLGPSTLETLQSLAINGVNSVYVVCPGFVCDCLETLEEIAITNKNIFLKHGGLTYNYIDCVNDSDDMANMLYNIITKG